MLILVILLGIGLPIYATWLAWQSRNAGWLSWGFAAVAAVSTMGFLTLVLRWDVLSVHLVWFWWAAVVLALGAGLVAVARRGGKEVGGRALVWSALNPVVGLALFGYALSGLLHDPAVELARPLEGGRLAVAQGGGNTVLNYHHAVAPQRYAIDIVALDGLGRRASGIEPSALEDYVIYGMPVLAPCDGEVIEAVDAIPESAIGETNAEAPAGNHLVVRCNGLDVTLAHLQPGTLAAAVGDGVSTGQRLGAAGNSGNTSEPHLHIHAVSAGTGSSGQGVALRFGGIFPVRNTVF